MAQGPRDYVDPNLYFPNSLAFMENSILQFLQAVFYNFPKKQNCYHYDDILDETEIAIEGQGTDNLREVDARPKIVVSRGPVSIRMTGMGSNSVGSANMNRGMQKHAVIRSGSVGISCFSREDLEADRLAEICADAIESLNSVIRQLGFLQIHMAQVGSRAMIKADSRPELFVTPLLIKAEITKNYNLQKLDVVKLRRVIYEFYIKPVNMTVR